MLGRFPLRVPLASVRWLAPFRVLTVCLGGLAACYSPAQPDCGFVCGPGGACPEDYACASNNRCVRTGASPSICPDAGIDSMIIPPADSSLDAYVDTLPPSVISTTPVMGAKGIPRNSPITIVFDEPVMNVDDQSFTVMSGVQPVLGTVSSTGTANYVFTPTADYLPNQIITVTLDSAITDYVGNPLVTFTFDFQTGTI